MQVRDARELLSWRLRSGVTQEEAHAIGVARGHGGHPAHVGEIQKKFHDGTPDIYRMLDEPGAWRWHSSCELVPMEQLQDMFAGDPQFQAELRERQMLEDKETALDVLKAVVNGNGAKPVEQRGQYALSKTGAGLFQVFCSGVPLMPGPAGEAIARAVFDAVAAPIVVPPDTSLAAELGA